MADKNEDRSTWASGGGLMIGIGVGFFFISTSIFFFIGSILAGLGVGLILTSFLSNSRNH
ncbi:hypothetical protein [Olavius algarvensis spirochete endosymbiont]|uniref:hypothetical protein n=1 Tax=Olavius algarvensis spirochete endosymbiont TaxID=260710 RepID=UPI000F51AE9C|nr:hypothetical protein [Olavius algarvensis spirochete endosymbiont]